MDKIQIFKNRLNKIGIEINLTGNFPWIYLDTVNGNKVKEKFMANHGFTIAFLPLKSDKQLEFTDIKEIFNIIRKYK
jgi:DNA-dependent RNA polymerase auxiliary subunit epsilon